MTIQRALRDLVDEMLRFTDPDASRIEYIRGGFTVVIGDATISFADDIAPINRQLERLATSIERSIAYTRAQGMLTAADATHGPLPLWLVTGSSVLASWLKWSRTETVFRRRLVLTKGPNAPVIGALDRRARQSIGQSGVKIRVRHGLAVAEKIVLSGRCKCIAVAGKDGTIRVEGNPLPETLITALNDDPQRNDRRRIAEIVDHPFFAATDLRLVGIRNDGNAAVIAVQSHWGPLAPVPNDARKVIPPDADPVSPWRATAREVTELYALVNDWHRHAGPA